MTIKSPWSLCALHASFIRSSLEHLGQVLRWHNRLSVQQCRNPFSGFNLKGFNFRFKNETIGSAPYQVRFIRLVCSVRFYRQLIKGFCYFFFRRALSFSSSLIHTSYRSGHSLLDIRCKSRYLTQGT